MPSAVRALVADKQVSSAGAGWLVQALDPFHDVQRIPSGYPDTTVGASFVEVVKLVQNFTVPAPGFAMDLHVFTLPQLGVREMWNTPLVSPTQIGNALPTSIIGDFGTVTVLGVPAGFPSLPYLSPTTGLWTAVPPAVINFAFDLSPFMIGDARLIGLGFEVHNTSPELLKSGSVVTYRAPQSLTSSMIYTVFPVDDATPAVDLKPIIRSSMPPATQAAALLLNGSQQWEAYDGAYVTSTMQTQSNPIDEPSYRDQIYFPTGSLDTAGVYAMTAAPRVSSMFPNTGTFVNETPWNTSGAYFAGLQPGTTLTVNVTAYIESFPQPDQYAYMTLTHPSTPFDAMALQLYAEAAYMLKPGTKVANNADGDHWKAISGILNRLAPRLGRIAGTAARGVAGIRKVQSTKGDIDALTGLLKEAKIFGKDVDGPKRTPGPRGNLAPGAKQELAQQNQTRRPKRRFLRPNADKPAQ